MRTTRIRITFGLLASIGALVFAVLGAASAMAKGPAPEAEFVVGAKLNRMGQEKYPAKIRGEGVGPQEFKFGKLNIVCQVATVKGQVASATSKELELNVGFKECQGGPFKYGNDKGTLEVHFGGKATLVYSYAGWVRSLKEVAISTRHLGCTIDWGGEWYPELAAEFPLNLYESAKYMNEEVPNSNLALYPTGMQKKVLIANSIGKQGIEWEEEETGVCEQPGVKNEPSSGERGKYFGKLAMEVVEGNIEFKQA